MKGRHLLALASTGFVAFGLACVDLFHGTDFETLCVHSPSDPACAPDAPVTVDVADVVTDTATPRPDFCAWTSSEAKDQAKRACAWLGACEGALGESDFGPCTVNAQLAYDCELNPALRPRGAVDAFWACLATVKSCGDVDRCVFPGGAQGCDNVDSGSFSACGTIANATTVRLECAGPAGRARGTEPCAMLGKTCTAEDLSNATCAGKLGFACTKSGCAGTSLVDCESAGTRMLDHGFDCADYGSGACVESDGGVGPYCSPGPETTSCTTDSPPTCDGNFAANTCVGGKNIRINCDKLGLPCDVSGLTAVDPLGACVKRGSGACSPGSDTCENGTTTLRSCGRGAFVDIDCASVGLGKCSVNAAGHGACAKP